jgi:chromosome segregation ATPase
VLARFFKKAEPIDTHTQVEEDHIQIALDEANAKLAEVEKERIREKIEVEKFKMSEEQLNKQIKNLF